MRTVVVTGSASGIGAATRKRLESGGARVIGVDLKGAEVEADLASAQGRRTAIERIGALCGERLDGLVTCAGLAGLPSRPGRVLTSLNFFGTIELLEALRPRLARGTQPAAVAISSNSTTTSPLVPRELSDLLLAGDAEGAAALADRLERLSVDESLLHTGSRRSREIAGQDLDYERNMQAIEAVLQQAAGREERRRAA